MSGFSCLHIKIHTLNVPLPLVSWSINSRVLKLVLKCGITNTALANLFRFSLCSGAARLSIGYASKKRVSSKYIKVNKTPTSSPKGIYEFLSTPLTSILWRQAAPKGITDSSSSYRTIVISIRLFGYCEVVAFLEQNICQFLEPIVEFGWVHYEQYLLIWLPYSSEKI